MATGAIRAYARPKKAAPKKPVPLEQYSKAELIKLAKKLQRDVTRLQALVDVPALPHGGPYTVTTIDRAEAEALAIRNAAAAELERRAKLPGIGPCKPAFPWEPK